MSLFAVKLALKFYLSNMLRICKQASQFPIPLHSRVRDEIRIEICIRVKAYNPCIHPC